MKNHSGRRSFLRFATSKRNRIISLCILPLVLLLSFFGSGRTVYADTDIQYINETVTATFLRWSSATTSFYTISDAEYLGQEFANYTQWGSRDSVNYRDVTITILEQFAFNPDTSVYNSMNYEYTGYFQLLNTFDITVTPANNNTNLYSYEYLSREISSVYDYDLNASTYTYTASGNNKVLRLSQNDILYVNRKGFASTTSNGPVYVTTTYKFRIFGTCTDPSIGGPNYSITVSRIGDSSSRGVFVRYNSEDYYTYNSLQVQKQILSSLGSAGGDIIAAINSASAQAHSDAATSQSQAADLIDDINYDHSGTSQSVSATQSAYDAAQGAADTAVDAAVHNYTSDLSTVEAYDYSSFFTSQRNSALFWRDVGEYILDSSNLGFVSGSIIIVTLIGLVIFMLRL